MTGRVQGVGFRWATARVAARYHVTGWVKNNPDGSVTIRAQADQQPILDQFIAAIKRSPAPYGNVMELKVQPQPVESFKKFRITDWNTRSYQVIFILLLSLVFGLNVTPSLLNLLI